MIHLLNMTIYSGFSNKKWWFSTAMLPEAKCECIIGQLNFGSSTGASCDRWHTLNWRVEDFSYRAKDCNPGWPILDAKKMRHTIFLAAIMSQNGLPFGSLTWLAGKSSINGDFIRKITDVYGTMVHFPARHVWLPEGKDDKVTNSEHLWNHLGCNLRWSDLPHPLPASSSPARASSCWDGALEL